LSIDCSEVIAKRPAAWYVARGVNVSSVLLLDADKAHDVFEVVELSESLARVRTAYLYEIGEELAVRITRDGATIDKLARVRAHAGSGSQRITELELEDLR
jgi:hypothetical protein